MAIDGVAKVLCRMTTTKVGRQVPASPSAVQILQLEMLDHEAVAAQRFQPALHAVTTMGPGHLDPVFGRSREKLIPIDHDRRQQAE